jgi:hypothetical protein
VQEREAQSADDQANKRIVLLTSSDPDARPTAEEALRHQFFNRMWEWTRDERRTCCICMEELPLSAGIECTNSGVGHFLCNGCLAGHVQEESTADLRLVAARDAKVHCPMSRGAGQLGCDACEYSDVDLALRLRDNPTSFAVYIGARQQLLEQRMAGDADERVRAELTRIVALDENERRVLQTRNHIIEEIINCHCPRCKQAFVDFDACFALKCSRCPCGFCAWCGEYSGGADAHAHVACCQHKPAGADVFFGSEKDFNEAQDRRRKRELQPYLDSLDRVTREDILRTCANELRGVL